MANELVKAYKAGITDMEREFMLGRAGERDFQRTIDRILVASERSQAPADLARLAGQAHAAVHLADQGLVKSNPRKETEKSRAAVERSRVVLKRAHAILASRGCSFKDAMVAAWAETKAGAIKANSGDNPTRGQDFLWLAAWDKQPWAQFEMARTGRAYNVPNMWAGQEIGELQANATRANPGLKKGQSLMKAAAKRYRAGEFSSMQEAVSAVAAERRR
jgi:hypothetical protein